MYEQFYRQQILQFFSHLVELAEYNWWQQHCHMRSLITTIITL